MNLQNTYKGLTVFLTGHTGFKGSWLALWLTSLGAKVIGYGLKPSTSPNHFSSIALEKIIVHTEGDIRDYHLLGHMMREHQPDIVFHLAAEAIVLRSFAEPKATFETNAIGTVNVLEAIRSCPSVKAAVMITSDKCYENVEWLYGYRENDRLGGSDPYSASKAMAELACRSYRDSYFQGKTALATARAGNVIGGGDFSDFRIVPDTMKSLMQKVPVQVRNPGSVRPWLHVLEPLYGYLLLGKELLAQNPSLAPAYNFGPKEQAGIDVKTLVGKAIEFWGQGCFVDVSGEKNQKEMGLLRLNWDLAAHHLNWKPQSDWTLAIKRTVDWFKAFERLENDPEKLYHTSLECIQHYQDEIQRNSSQRLISH